MKVKRNAFLALGLEENGWAAAYRSHPLYPRGKGPTVAECIWGGMGLRADLDAATKIKNFVSARNRTSVLRHITSIKLGYLSSVEGSTLEAKYLRARAASQEWKGKGRVQALGSVSMRYSLVVFPSLTIPRMAANPRWHLYRSTKFRYILLHLDIYTGWVVSMFGNFVSVFLDKM
jgi:hypothetical protein